MTPPPVRQKTLIAVFLDGTMNSAAPPETAGRTHVRRLFEELRNDDSTATLYLPGVGCEPKPELDDDSAGTAGIAGAVAAILGAEGLSIPPPFKALFGAAFGAGLSARVLAAYAFICAAREQHPAARLCLLGFSRGAYACCVLTHFMAHAGFVVAKENLGLFLDSVRQAWTYDEAKLAAMIANGGSKAWRLPTNAEAIRVDFLGCWDTVCAVGGPENGMACDFILGSMIDGLCGLVHRQVKASHPRLIDLFVPPNVLMARHALALHEYRVSFEPLLWSPPEQPDPAALPTDLRQTWLPGAHADVGGGYVEAATPSATSDYALRWMKNQMWPQRWFAQRPLAKPWPIHDSSSGIYKRMCPQLRQALLRPSTAQLQSMELCEQLQFALHAEPEFLSCDDKQPSSGAPASTTAFRPAIASLHTQANGLARLIWLRSALAKTAAKQPAGTVPPAYADPSQSEAQQALSFGTRDFTRELHVAALATMDAGSTAQTARLARLCCHHLAMAPSDLDSLIQAACEAIDQAQGLAAKRRLFGLLQKVLIEPLGFAISTQKRNCARLRLKISMQSPPRPDAPAAKQLRI